MKAILAAVAAAVALSAPAAAEIYGGGSFIQVQGRDQKGGRGGQGPGGDRRQHPQPDPRGQPRPDDRRGQMTDDERRALHQDLDKANRELYRRRFPQ